MSFSAPDVTRWNTSSSAARPLFTPPAVRSLASVAVWSGRDTSYWCGGRHRLRAANSPRCSGSHGTGPRSSPSAPHGGDPRSGDTADDSGGSPRAGRIPWRAALPVLQPGRRLAGPELGRGTRARPAGGGRPRGRRGTARGPGRPHLREPVRVGPGGLRHPGRGGGDRARFPEPAPAHRPHDRRGQRRGGRAGRQRGAGLQAAGRTRAAQDRHLRARPAPLVPARAVPADLEELQRRAARLGGDDLATIVYTSGTTGESTAGGRSQPSSRREASRMASPPRYATDRGHTGSTRAHRSSWRACWPLPAS